MELKLRTYAKINLYLSVGERIYVEARPGKALHSISTIIQNISLSDELVIRKAGSGIDVVCDKIAPSGKENIVYKALDLLKSRYKIGGFRVRITKNIPSGAGLGGGSSNAAAALQAAVRLFDININKIELLELAHEIGSDVPFFIYGGCAHVSGTGNIVKKISPLLTQDKTIAIAKPSFSISTKEAYAAIDKVKGKGEKTIQAKNINLKNCRNDFEDWALGKHKELARIKKIAMENGALSSCLTGSGSAVFAIFENRLKSKRFRNLLENEKLVSQVFLTKAANRSMRYLN